MFFLKTFNSTDLEIHAFLILITAGEKTIFHNIL